MKTKRKTELKKRIKHANFLRNVKDVPKHWFSWKSKGKSFVNLKTHKDLTINPTYTKGDYHYGKGNDYVHVIYGGKGLKVLKNIKSAKKYVKEYMRKY